MLWIKCGDEYKQLVGIDERGKFKKGGQGVGGGGRGVYEDHVGAQKEL